MIAQGKIDENIAKETINFWELIVNYTLTIGPISEYLHLKEEAKIAFLEIQMIGKQLLFH